MRGDRDRRSARRVLAGAPAPRARARHPAQEVATTIDELNLGPLGQLDGLITEVYRDGAPPSEGRQESEPVAHDGEVAKWLGNGLQNRYTRVRIPSSPP